MRSIGLPELLVLFGVLFLFGLALFFLAAALRWKQSRSVQRALVDKLPADQLAALLQTPHGEKLMQTLSEAGASPGRSVLVAVQRGIIVLVTGAGVFVAATVHRAPSVVLAMATVMIFLGFGLLAAAFVSYLLSKRWHLLEENGGKPANPRTD